MGILAAEAGAYNVSGHRVDNRTTCNVLSPFRYESVIATLCENLDSLDEPEARAAMIWIVGEYAERIDNADELLESFLEGFHDESTQVGLGEWWV